MAKTKSKAEKPTEPVEEKKDNTQMLSLSAEIAIDQMFLHIGKPSFDDIVVFATDVVLRSANIIKGGVVGETDQEKMKNAVNLIQKVAIDSIDKNAVPPKE